MGQIEKIENKSRKDMEKDLMDVICCLDAYVDSGLTPDEVMDLSEAVKKPRGYAKRRAYLSGKASLRVRNISERQCIYGECEWIWRD